MLSRKHSLLHRCTQSPQNFFPVLLAVSVLASREAQEQQDCRAGAANPQCVCSDGPEAFPSCWLWSAAGGWAASSSCNGPGKSCRASSSLTCVLQHLLMVWINSWGMRALGMAWGSHCGKWSTNPDTPARVLTSAKQCLLGSGFFFQVRHESMGQVMVWKPVMSLLIYICSRACFYSSRIFMCSLKLIGLLVIEASGDLI